MYERLFMYVYSLVKPLFFFIYYQVNHNFREEEIFKPEKKNVV